jgi:hypothetical protein
MIPSWATAYFGDSHLELSPNKQLEYFFYDVAFPLKWRE